MKINKDLDNKINEFPNDLADLARLLLSELEGGRKSNSTIEELIREEVRDIVLEEEEK
ncbi:hypothetical protein [Bacillus sp. AFS029533]|uniref:hypothetical protein n=1 Tax=Bacillus sp. AFS029533 TaxID=2033494 RepID=UPI0015D48B60|nr:hypothetical protein [Bacillus sp. AFS029533]